MEKKGEFKSCLFLAFDLDLTGNKLIDEMTNIGVYGVDEQTRFRQYVIPHRNINIFATRRSLLKTANIHEFRVVKDCITRRAVKTKTEIFALFDFLNFLESLDAKKNGICLMHFESSKLIPFILLDALRRYKLLERFNKVVKGFADCHDFVKENCASSIPNFTLRTLVKILLNRENEKFHDAFERSKLIYEIVTHLSEGESQNKLQDLANGVCPFVKSVDEVELELSNMKEFLQKQYALTPIFLSRFKESSLRLKALQLRKLLTTTDVTYETLKASFEAKNDMSELLKAKLGEAATENDTAELVQVINAHFEKGPEEEMKADRFARSRFSRRKSSGPNQTGAAKTEEVDTAELAKPQTDENKEVTIKESTSEVKVESSPKPETEKLTKAEVSPKPKADTAAKSPKIDVPSKPKSESPKKIANSPKPKKSVEPKPKSAEPKQKSADVKSNSPDGKSKSSELKPKSADPKPKSADPKPKSADPKPKSTDQKAKSADPKAKSAEPNQKDSSKQPKNDSPAKSSDPSIPTPSDSPQPPKDSSANSSKEKPAPKPKSVKAPLKAGKKAKVTTADPSTPQASIPPTAPSTV